MRANALIARATFFFSSNRFSERSVACSLPGQLGQGKGYSRLDQLDTFPTLVFLCCLVEIDIDTWVYHLWLSLGERRESF